MPTRSDNGASPIHAAVAGAVDSIGRAFAEGLEELRESLCPSLLIDARFGAAAVIQAKGQHAWVGPGNVIATGSIVDDFDVPVSGVQASAVLLDGRVHRDAEVPVDRFTTVLLHQFASLVRDCARAGGYEDGRMPEHATVVLRGGIRTRWEESGPPEPVRPEEVDKKWRRLTVQAGMLVAVRATEQ